MLGIDAFDFEEPISGRIKRVGCTMADGEKIKIGCHEVKGICDQGCSMDNARYRCDPTRPGRTSCAYILWDCGPKISNNGCIKHFYSGTMTCHVCCKAYNCGSDMPKCF